MPRLPYIQHVSFLAWPLTLAAALLVFGLSAQGTLSLISENADKLIKPAATRSQVNVPPVKQLADPVPVLVAPKISTTSGEPPGPEASWATRKVALVALAPAVLTSPVAAEPGSPGRIGQSAVNLRSGPSKNSGKLGVLAAGAIIRIGERNGAWVHVWHPAGDGWVYSTYVDQLDTAWTASQSVSVPTKARVKNSTTRQIASATKPRKGKAVEIGSRITARDTPRAGSASVFRLLPGERVQILDSKGGWLKVVTASGDTGWIKGQID